MATTTTRSLRPLLAAFDRRAWLWLLVGGALIVASQMRFGVGALAWVAPVPLLRYVRVTSGWCSRFCFLGASTVAWTLAVLKIITAPLPPVFALLYGVPLGLALGLPYLLAGVARGRAGEAWRVMVFAGAGVLAEWMLHGLLPFGTWGAAANTQLDQLALLQLASVTGLHGVSFLVYLVGASLEGLLAAPFGRAARVLALALGLVLAVVAAGQARLTASTGEGAERVRVAAVGTDSFVGQGPLPSPAEIAEVRRGLSERTRAAARAGAQLVVWTEAATMVEPAEEPAFLEDVAALARESFVTVVAGYVVPISRSPLRYRNRYAFVTPAGLHHVYDKHRPVPGEPAVAGVAPMPLFESPELGRVSGAICYDYDFPRLALEHARLAADLVVLPASDWRGIDPLHTEMAAVRAIEGGHSLVRSTRFGLSAGFDPQGRARGWLSAFDEGDRVLVTSVPRHAVTTVYGTLGDWFPLACLALVLGPLLVPVARRRYRRMPWTPFSRSRVERCSTPAGTSGSTSIRSSERWA